MATSRKTGNAKPTGRGTRLSRDMWLQQSLNLLARRGPSALTLESLTRHFKVTTGSFYWHFKSHANFLNQLTDKYVEDYTQVVADHLATLDLPPRDRLLEASRIIITEGLSSLDIHFRSLAITYPKLKPKIVAMDEFRTKVIQGIFEDMGFRGDNLRMRVHTFVILHSMEHGVSTCLPPDSRLELLGERIRLLAD